MCSLQCHRYPGPHGERGESGQHPDPPNRPAVVFLGEPLCPVRRLHGRLPRGRGWGFAAGRPGRRRKRPATEGGLCPGLAPDVGSNRCTSRFPSEFPGMLLKGTVSACLCAAMRSAPGSWAGGAPCGGGWGGIGATADAMAGGVADGTSSWGGVRPRVSSCPHRGAGNRPAGPRGRTTSWGRSCTGPSTIGAMARTTPGRRPASGSPPETPWSPPRRGG